jgi:hypothetical protein
MINLKADRVDRHVSPMGKMRNVDTILIRNPEGERPLVRWEDRVGLLEIACEDVAWTYVAEDMY